MAIVMRRCLALPAWSECRAVVLMPVDRTTLMKRRAIFEDSAPVTVVLTKGLEDKVPVSLPTVMRRDAIYNAVITPITTPPAPQDCVYVLFTSGTTGRPKGMCPISHSKTSWFSGDMKSNSLAVTEDGSHDDGVSRREGSAAATGMVLQRRP